MKFNDTDVRHFPKDEWDKYFAKNAHLICFNEHRDSALNRIDFALVTFDKDIPSTYVTCREFDAETLYWQYGGAFPNTKNTVSVWKNYCALRDWSLERYKRITTYVENTNLPMLKMAMQAGYRIIGVRLFHGDILVELLNEGE